MRISTETGSLIQKVGERRMIEILSQAGFQALDYTFSPFMEEGDSPWNGSGYKAHAREIAEIARDHGVVFNQAHAPFLFQLAVDEVPDYTRHILPLLARCLECASLLGIPHVVVHPLHNLRYRKFHDVVWKLNLDFYRSLAPYAQEFGVKIALENMFQNDALRKTIVLDMLNDPNEYVSFYDELDDKEHFICLLDTGHSGLAGEDAADSIRILGPRLKALHVNDNCFTDDHHLIPYQGMIDWDRVLHALSDIGYRGDFTFEALHVWEHGDESFYPVQARYLYEVGQYMVQRLEQFKAKE